MLVKDLLSPSAIIPDLVGNTAEQILAELSQPLLAATGIAADRLAEALVARERLGSTGVGDGVALPHAKLDGLPGLVAAFGRSRRGVDFKSVDSRPATLFLALLSPVNGHGAHLNALARLSRLFKSPALREALLAADGAADIHRAIIQEDGK